MKEQKGFTHIGLVIVLLVVVFGIGFAIWRVSSANKKAGNAELHSGSNSTQNSDNRLNPSESATRFEVKDFYFSVSEKAGWNFTDTSVREDDRPFILVVEGKNDNLNVKMYTLNGKGGDCTPKAGDPPHGPNNECPTLERLSHKETDSGYIIRNKYSLSKLQFQNQKPVSQTTYEFCVQPKQNLKYTSIPLGTNEAIMGAQYACSTSNIFVELDGIDNSNLSFFDTDLAKKVEDMLLSINYKHYE